MTKNRCDWAKHPLDVTYHDQVWGTPQMDDQELFTYLILEGLQAGLSWSTILKKQNDLLEAFDQFDPHKLKNYDEEKIQALLKNPNVIRNQLKICSVVSNAKHFLEVQQEFGSFKDYLWRYVDFKPIQNHWETIDQVPSSTPLSKEISKDLKKRGFKFVGPTIIYAYMQAIGMVNDHLTTCFRHQEIKKNVLDNL